MDESQIEVTDQPAEIDWQCLEDSINQFNMQLTGYHNYRPLAVFIHDAGGAIIAGLTAFTWGGTLRILVLWVHANWRGHGLGTHYWQQRNRRHVLVGASKLLLRRTVFKLLRFIISEDTLLVVWPKIILLGISTSPSRND